MNDRLFVDTNVLIYARDDRFPEKQNAAVQWIRILSASGRLVINPQIISEFCNAGTKRGLVSDGELRGAIELLTPWSLGHVDVPLIEAAIRLRQLTRYQWWDCMILAAALSAGCRYLLTEDMSHQQTVETLTIVNPFKISPATLLGAH